MAIVLFVMVLLCVWWAGGADTATAARREQAKQLAELLAGSAERLLASGDVSGVRGILVDSGRLYQLERCRLILPDGRIFADADPTQINQAQWPAQWPAGTIDEQLKTESPTSVATLVRIPGRGTAALHVQFPVPKAEASNTWTPVFGVWACGLAAAVLVYRRLCRRLLPLVLIRDALRAIGAGERDADLLSLAGDNDGVTSHWNALLRENRELHEKLMAERAKAAVTNRRGSGGGLDGIVESLSTGVVVLDNQLKACAANGAAAALMGVEHAKLIGADFTQLIADAELTTLISSILAGTGQRRTVEIDRTEYRGGILRINVRPMRRDDQGSVLLTIEDITQQRVADASRNSFVAQATHELRAPLTNMRLCLEAAMDGDTEPTTLASHLNLINIESRRLERLVSEMLSVAEIEAGSLQLRSDDVRLDKLFDELRSDYTKQSQEKNITFKLDLPPKLPVIQGDRDKLAAALHNLVSNAMKYTPAGGRVTVVVREEGGNLIVEVSDTGIGIADADKSRIFEKFFRARDTRVAKITGTGLGLALAKEMARLHGGDLTFTSELDRGSTFTISIPAKAKAA